jgi:DNA polymerase-3 subunit epsilon
MITHRELVLDTETTGFSSETGDKIVEIGVVELINHIPTTNYFHKYLNPQRSIPDSAFKVHGLSYDFLKDKPLFSDIADEFLTFIKTDPIIIHNAPFDLSFLNNELSIIGKESISNSRVIDSLVMAREKFPGSPASLDALCRRFTIDNSKRDLHGALLDSHILAQVYLELIGGRQPNLELYEKKNFVINIENNRTVLGRGSFNRETQLPNRLTVEETNSHKKLIATINGLKNWSIYS